LPPKNFKEVMLPAASEAIRESGSGGCISRLFRNPHSEICSLQSAVCNELEFVEKGADSYFDRKVRLYRDAVLKLCSMSMSLVLPNEVAA
jgi:hypothetical protein